MRILIGFRIDEKLRLLIFTTKVSEFVFSRIAVVHSWFPVLLALTS
ncbi:unannotated protein [freshwater metagenome]|uniref:Unannotated protein n=1 Tax=freshwater metagenome TaxID=449393 RepID=A0A6J7RZC5_9ZZZZ